MLRFVDLSEAYWTDGRKPICAFLSTSDDRFLTTDSGEQTFSDMEEIELHPQSERMKRLMPPNYFGENIAGRTGQD